MLNSLRRWAAGWVASILIGLLVLSFAIWGVADVFTGFGARWLAKVGNQEISTQEFQRAYREELERLSPKGGPPISAEQGRAFGLDRQVLDNLVSLSALESQAVELGMGLSDETLAEDLKAEPMFRGADGKFSRRVFNELLAKNGLTKEALLVLRRRDKLRSGILKALESATVVPKPLVETLYGWRNATRSVSYATIDTSKVLKSKTATDEDLKKAYEDNKSRYMSEPTRHLNVLLLELDALKNKVTVTDEAVKEAYEATRASYDKPEMRRIQQISFSDAAAAAAAKKEIDGGMSFEDAAKKAGKKDGDIDLGLVKKSALFDSKIADGAFALNNDEVSGVIEGQFTTVLVRVLQIEAAKVSTFAEVKGDVRAKLAGEMARVNLRSVYSEVDEAIGAGTPLAEIAKTLDLQFLDIPSVDSKNMTAEGGLALNIKDAPTIVSAGFAGQVSIEQDPVQLKDGSFAWVSILGVTPAKLKPYDDVKAQVQTAWEDMEKRKSLSEIAAKLVERLNAGETLEKIAKEVGGKVETSDPVTRARIPDGLNQSVMTQAFVLQKGRASSAETSDGASRVLFRVKDVAQAPAATQDQIDALSRELKSVFQREQSGEYIEALKARSNVQINETLYQRMTGVGAQ